MKIPFILNHFTQEQQPIIQFKEAVYSSNIKEIWGNDKMAHVVNHGCQEKIVPHDYRLMAANDLHELGGG